MFSMTFPRVVNSYRKRKTRVRIVTLPKAGTHFLMAVLPRLGIRKPRITHVIDLEDRPMLLPDERAAMGIRDPRGFFVSLANWCDMRCRELEEGRITPEQAVDMRVDRAGAWRGYEMERKIRYLATCDDRAMFEPARIRPHFDCVDACLARPGILTFRFEDMMAWDGTGVSARQLDLFRRLLGHFGIAVSDAELIPALEASRGNSKTFFRGTADGWRNDLSATNERLILERWGRYVRSWGYAKSEPSGGQSRAA